jgi:hypothetical protein
MRCDDHKRVVTNRRTQYTERFSQINRELHVKLKRTPRLLSPNRPEKWRSHSRAPYFERTDALEQDEGERLHDLC